MRYVRFRRPSKSTIFAILMAGTLAVVLLPGDLLNPLRLLGQATAPVQLAAKRATDRAGESLEELGARSVSAQHYAEAVQQLKALENENIALRQSNRELEKTNAALMAIREQGLPRTAALIPAKVIAPDAAPGRESLLVTKGRLKDVRRGSWVTSGLAVDAGRQDGVPEQAAVLARQCLMGWVAEVYPLTSRVVLLSDPLATKVMVRIGAGSGPDVDFALEGAGNGRMRIPDIPADWVERQQAVRVGDPVTISPNDPTLPLALVIGHVTALDRDPDKPLLYDAVVEHQYPPKSLSQVFIVNLSAGSAGAQPAGSGTR